MHNVAETACFLILLLGAEVSNTAPQIGSLHIAVRQRFSDLAAFAQLRQIAAQGNNE
jgi:hypothetical protein